MKKFAEILNQPGGDLNDLVASNLALAPSTEKVSGTALMSDQTIKNIPDSQATGAHLKKVRVFDSYSQVQVPIYRTEEVEASSSDAAN